MTQKPRRRKRRKGILLCENLFEGSAHINGKQKLTKDNLSEVPRKAEASCYESKDTMVPYLCRKNEIETHIQAFFQEGGCASIGINLSSQTGLK
jgi:hypothetical protein